MAPWGCFWWGGGGGVTVQLPMMGERPLVMSQYIHCMYMYICRCTHVYMYTTKLRLLEYNLFMSVVVFQVSLHVHIY